jgi:FixJ family two-component response regulator
MTFKVVLPRIHVFDDDLDLVDLIKELLAINNIEGEFFSMQDLLVKSLDLKPDIIVIDWQPSDATKFTGMQLTGLIRQKLPEAYIIAITGGSVPDDVVIEFYDEMEGYSFLKKDPYEKFKKRFIIRLQKAIEHYNERIEHEKSKKSFIEKVKALENY